MRSVSRFRYRFAFLCAALPHASPLVLHAHCRRKIGFDGKIHRSQRRMYGLAVFNRHTGIAEVTT